MNPNPFLIKKTLQTETVLKEVVKTFIQYSSILQGKPQFIALAVEGLFFNLKVGREPVTPCLSRNYLTQKYMSISHPIQDELKK